jgi:hypothetical protein
MDVVAVVCPSIVSAQLILHAAHQESALLHSAKNNTLLKKVCHFPVPSRDVTILSLDGSRESLVSDIPAGDGKIVNLFFTVQMVSVSSIRFLLYFHHIT